MTLSPIDVSQEEEDGETTGVPPFPIVGIGASAGGLEALTALLRAVTLDSVAFIVVQHLAPNDHLLPGILARSAHMPVVQIDDGMPVESNHVYVAPPGANVGLLHGVLHLMAPAAPLPIDAFFRSLSEDQGHKAIGVVLSGMGTDGTQGLKEIKARGGLAFCQDPSSAKYDSMPRSALDSGVVDGALSPEGIATELATIVKHPYLTLRRPPEPPASERDELAKLFILLRSAFGNDLSLYKPSTINRRIERRMALHKLEALADYVHHVQTDPEELKALYQDILIGVTSFFRDGEPFDLIKRLIFPRIVEHKTPGASVRCWVPACASGEEAYSLGICLLEVMDQAAPNLNVRIFGTDVDERAIMRARRGVYPASIEADVSPERLRRFFVKVGTDYQVARRLRDLIVFSPQNITKDAPFSRLDLVSCRNLLIYFQSPLQKKVLHVLDYALAPNGYLVLGNSETIGDSADEFSLVDRKNKIYVKKSHPVSTAVHPDLSVDAAPAVAFEQEADRRAGFTAEQAADRKLLERYVPPSVLINESYDVLQFRGDTGSYLSPTPGTATLNLLKLLLPELHVEVWRAVQRAFKDNVSVRVDAVRFAHDPELERTVAFDVLPIHDSTTKSRCALVIFEEVAALTTTAPTPDATGTHDETMDRVRDLEHRLASTKDYLQSTIEELETSNEELKSTNEELQSSNEELQSTNEELETSKEELQSTNEELVTMNAELQHRMTEFVLSTSDLDNLLASLEQPVLFLDSDLRVRRMTEAAQELLKLAPGDLGRPIAHLTARFAGKDLEKMVRTTIGRLLTTTEQVLIAERWFEARAVPYRAPGGVVDGALVTFRDVDAEARRREFVLDIRAYAEKLLAALPQPLAIVDRELRVLWVNDPFLATFRVDSKATLGNLVQNLGSGQWAHPRLRAAMDNAIASGEPFHDFRIEHDFDGLGRRAMTVSGSVVAGVGGPENVLLLSIIPAGGTMVATSDP